jgi:hypothetical protein
VNSKYGDEYVRVSASSGNDFDELSHLYPAIALPVRSKTTFACPPEHLSTLDEALSSCSRLLIIGWRGQEEHFKRRWRDTGSRPDKILIVCGSRDAAQFTSERLSEAGIATGAFASELPFRGLIGDDSGALDWLLSDRSADDVARRRAS